jgi:hypothetical protein
MFTVSPFNIALSYLLTHAQFYLDTKLMNFFGLDKI